MVDQEQIKRADLEKLDKNQLIAFILKNFAPSEDTEAKIIVVEPPTDFNTIKLPSGPVKAARGHPAKMDKRASLACPPLPAAPPVPSSGYIDEPKKKSSKIPPEKMVGTHKIIVKCEKCDHTFIIDMPRKLVLANPLEVVPVTIMHARDHALTVYLDQNFESRRDYVSELFYLDQAPVESSETSQEE